MIRFISPSLTAVLLLLMPENAARPLILLSGLARFSESILDYVANIEAAPYPDITLDRFYGEIFSAYDVLFNVWMKSNEPKVQ